MSVWVLASRLIHRHISIPFLGGVALFIFRFFYVYFFNALGGGNLVLVIYVAFVALASIITVMASKASTQQATAFPLPG